MQMLFDRVGALRASLLALGVALMVLAMSSPALAQAAPSASELTGPMTTGAQSAITAGFGVAAVILVGFIIYKVVRRFTG